MSWNFVCDLTLIVSERFHDQKGTIMDQAPGWVQDFIFFIFFVQNWLPWTQRPFPLNSWWKNGPFWCKKHCSCSKTVDFSIFSGGARKKIGTLGGPLRDMTPNTLGYHFSYIFRKSQWVWGGPGPQITCLKWYFVGGRGWINPSPHPSLIQGVPQFWAHFAFCYFVSFYSTKIQKLVEF